MVEEFFASHLLIVGLNNNYVCTACEEPVMVCHAAALKTVVVHGCTGAMVQPGDILGLSSAILQLIDDKNFSEQSRTMPENTLKNM